MPMEHYQTAVTHQSVLLRTRMQKQGKYMKIRIVSIGKTKDDALRNCILSYVARLAHYAPTEYVELPDSKLKSLSDVALKKTEGMMILENLKAGELLVVMDERGEQFTSLAFSQWLQKKMNTGRKSACFVIGGAFGFAPEVYARADAKISLSQFTFPHDLARLILSEQLYRAFTLLKGERYHHD